MKVACIQLSSSENYNKNFKEILNYINIAIAEKSDFIITPETSSIITDNKKKLFKFSYEMKNDPLIKEIIENFPGIKIHSITKITETAEENRSFSEQKKTKEK